jgi:hypothetical protein
MVGAASANEKDDEKRAWQQLWSEHIRKEQKRQKLNTSCHINPRSRQFCAAVHDASVGAHHHFFAVQIIGRKPGHCHPIRTDGRERELDKSSGDIDADDG